MVFLLLDKIKMYSSVRSLADFSSLFCVAILLFRIALSFFTHLGRILVSFVLYILVVLFRPFVVSYFCSLTSSFRCFALLLCFALSLSHIYGHKKLTMQDLHQNLNVYFLVFKLLVPCRFSAGPPSVTSARH